MVQSAPCAGGNDACTWAEVTNAIRQISDPWSRGTVKYPGILIGTEEDGQG